MGKLKQNQPITSRTEDKTTFFYYAFRNILLVGLPLVLISALVLLHSSSHSSADSSNTSSDSLSISISSACTLSSSTDSVHTVAVNASTYTANIGNTRVNAYCNDNNGYSIYAIGTSGDTDGNTKLISNINDSYNISTGIYDSSTLSSTTPSSWSMKLTAGSGTGAGGEAVTPPTIVNNYSNYNVVPSTYTLVASRGSGTNMTSNTDITGSYFTTTYDVYASSVQPAGTYTGKVKYAMIHPYSSSSVVTFEDAFARAGKEQVTVPGSGIYYKMQDMNTAICNSVNVYNETSSIQLIDIRDNNIYWVNKLEDGHCWMTQNLDLAIGSTNTPLTSENTDISTTASGNGIYDTINGGYSEEGGVWTWMPDSTAFASNHIISDTSVPNWSNQNTQPYSAEAGDTYYYTSNSTSNDVIYTSLANCTDNGHSKSDCQHYHAGNYYNWTAAIATNNSTGISNNFANANNSVCPKGWRLPIATNSDESIYEFGDLLYTYYNIITTKTSNNSNISYTINGFNDIRKNPLWYIRPGGIDNNTLNASTIDGYYWSSTTNSNATAYNLLFRDSGLGPARILNKGFGFSIRCLAR